VILAGDIGGTKTTLALCDDKGGIQREATEASSDFASLEDVITKFAPGEVTAACFGVAGPVVDGTAKITNLPWTIAQSSLARAFTSAKYASPSTRTLGIGTPMASSVSATIPSSLPWQLNTMLAFGSTVEIRSASRFHCPWKCSPESIADFERSPKSKPPASFRFEGPRLNGAKSASPQSFFRRNTWIRASIESTQDPFGASRFIFPFSTSSARGGSTAPNASKALPSGSTPTLKSRRSGFNSDSIDCGCLRYP